jgi:hypothetical protein
MRIDCLLLCDAATVRDGLLFLLGGGITQISRPEYPAALSADLALALALTGEEAVREHLLEARLRHVSSDEEIGRVELSFQANAPAGPDRPTSVCFALPLRPVSLPLPGEYELTVTILGHPTPQSIRFDAVLELP